MSASDLQGGFTLTEVLVAAGLLALAGAMIGQGFASDRAALHRVETRESAIEQIADAQDLIRERLERLFPAARFDSQGATVKILGAPDSLDFLTAEPSGARSPIRRMLLDRTSAGELELQEGAPDESEAAPSSRAVLLRDIARLDIAYYGPEQAGGVAAWRSDWTRAGLTPQLVRVRVSFPDHDRRIWPELIVHPAPEVDTACVLDLAALQCRGRA